MLGRTGRKSGQWSSSRRWARLCPTARPLLLFFRLHSHTCPVLPCAYPTHRLRSWKPQSKSVGLKLLVSFSFSIASNGQRNRLTLPHPHPQHQTVKSLCGVWTWGQIWLLDIVWLRSLPSSITSESIVDSLSLYTSAKVSAVLPALDCTDGVWPTVVLSNPAFAQLQPWDTGDLSFLRD